MVQVLLRIRSVSPKCDVSKKKNPLTQSSEKCAVEKEAKFYVPEWMENTSKIRPSESA